MHPRGRCAACPTTTTTTTVLQLYSLHYAASIKKEAIDFMHVSKSGGTSFCELSGELRDARHGTVR